MVFRQANLADMKTVLIHCSLQLSLTDHLIYSILLFLSKLYQGKNEGFFIFGKNRIFADTILKKEKNIIPCRKAPAKGDAFLL